MFSKFLKILMSGRSLMVLAAMGLSFSAVGAVEACAPYAASSTYAVARPTQYPVYSTPAYRAPTNYGYRPSVNVYVAPKYCPPNPSYR